MFKSKWLFFYKGAVKKPLQCAIHFGPEPEPLALPLAPNLKPPMPSLIGIFAVADLVPITREDVHCRGFTADALVDEHGMGQWRSKRLKRESAADK